MNRNVSIALVTVGSLILAAVAALHFTGYSEITVWANNLADQSFFARAIPSIWLFPFVHWVVIAIALMAATWCNARSLRVLLLGCAILLVADAVLIFIAVGPFVGSAMLMASAGCYFLASVETKTANS